MAKKISCIIAGLFALIPTVFSHAAFSEYADFNKNLFMFPQSAALGNANLVYNRDGGLYCNPSTLPLDSSTIYSLAYAGYYENTFSTSVGSYIRPITNQWTMGIAVGYLHIPNIEITSELATNEKTGDPIFDPNKVAYKTASEIFFNASLGHIFYSSKKIQASAGGAVHAMRMRLIPSIGYGIGADIGASVVFPRQGIRTCLYIENVTTNYSYWSKSFKEKSPPHIRIGMGYANEYPYIYGSLAFSYTSPDLLSKEGVYTNWFSDDTDPRNVRIKDEPLLLLSAARYGIEYAIYKAFFLRAGIDETKRTFFGSGLNLFSRTLIFDFAYMMPYELPGTYSLSMSYQFK